tara:strand:+ start:457 stop:627 length:171 start_codon:yes stop_codon:yes gene_type:complete
MELKHRVRIKGLFIRNVLSLITDLDLKDKELDFLYGVDEYTEDIDKIKKQFKRLWR